MLHGTRLDVRFELVNQSAERIAISKLVGSCGCMVLSGDSGPLPTPLNIEPNGRTAIAVKVRTDRGNGVGSRDFTVMAYGKSAGGKQIAAVGRIQVTLLSGLQAEPAYVLLRNINSQDERSVEIEVADTLTDPGVRIRDVVVSDPARMSVELRQAAGASKVFGDSGLGRQRAILVLKYRPCITAGLERDKVTVVPEDPIYPILEIPVECSVAGPGFGFVPSSLTFTETFDTVTREIAFKADDSVTLSVEKCPPGIAAKIIQGPRRRIVSITCEKNAFRNGDCELVFLVDGVATPYSLRSRPIE